MKRGSDHHIIHKVIINPILSGKCWDPDLSTTLHQLSMKKIPDMVDQALSDLPPIQGNMLLDKISLDLGEIQWDQWQEDFEKQLNKEITHILREKINRAQSHSYQHQSSGNSQQVIEVNPNGAGHDSQHQNDLTTLEHFLMKGIVPIGTTSDWDPIEVISSLFKENQEAIYNIAVKVSRYPRSALRLIHYLTDEQFVRVSEFQFGKDISKLVHVLYETSMLVLDSGTFDRIRFWQVVLPRLGLQQTDQDEIQVMKRLISIVADEIDQPPDSVRQNLIEKVKNQRSLYRKLIGVFEEGLPPADPRESSISSRADTIEVADHTGKKPPLTGRDQITTNFDNIIVSNGGIILLWPFLESYFEHLGLTCESRFVDDDRVVSGIHLLHYLGTGNESGHEYEMALNKVLCGLDIDVPVPSDIQLSDREKSSADEVILSLIKNWEAVGDTSSDSIRETFFNREGLLSEVENGWRLKIERQTWDILLDRLPWGIGLIKLPWMKDLLHVDWN